MSDRTPEGATVKHVDVVRSSNGPFPTVKERIRPPIYRAWNKGEAMTTPAERDAIDDAAATIAMAVVQAIRNGKDAVEAVRPHLESVRQAGLREAADIARVKAYELRTGERIADASIGAIEAAIAIEARAKEKQH
jgi:hypothetical protein